MTDDNAKDFTGRWLHEGDRRGQDFSHSQPDYDHPGQAAADTVKMRHATVSQEGKPVKVWAPAGWSEQQIAEALESNW